MSAALGELTDTFCIILLLTKSKFFSFVDIDYKFGILFHILVQTSAMKSYKLFGPIMIGLLIITSCNVAKNYFSNGDFENAVTVAAQNLRANNKRKTDIIVLEKAFRIIQQRDLNRIQQLKLEGNPNKWEEIYTIYTRINQRQQLVKPLLPLFVKKEFRDADIQLVNIDAELADSKNKTSEFIYTNGSQLLASKNKSDIRAAHAEFTELERINPNYKDTRLKINEALEKGVQQIYISIKNEANVVLPKDFEQAVTQINTADLNTRWLRFTTNSNTPRDHSIIISLKMIDVSPERVSDKQYKEQNTIQDGFYYPKDKNGNFLKDSLGNKIKEPKMITVGALVKETRQYKTAIVSGDFQFFDIKQNQLVKSVPFSETVVFENFFAQFLGDRRALSQVSLRKIGGTPLPFPADLQMIMDAHSFVKNRVQDKIRENINLLMN